MDALELRSVDDGVRAEMLTLRVSDEQAGHVGGTMADVLAEADEWPEANPWLRGVYLEGDPVGFVMLSWDVEPDPPDVWGPWFLWKMVVDEQHQGKGIGSAIVRVVADLVRAEGASELLTSHVDEPGGPGPFYERLGFVDTGQRDGDGEVVRALSLG